MPVYDYRCDNCGESFEVFLSLSEAIRDKNKPKCKHCESKKTRRVILAPAQVVFVGDGFYINDKDKK